MFLALQFVHIPVLSEIAEPQYSQYFISDLFIIGVSLLFASFIILGFALEVKPNIAEIINNKVGKFPTTKGNINAIIEPLWADTA